MRSTFTLFTLLERYSDYKMRNANANLFDMNLIYTMTGKRFFTVAFS